MAGDSNYPLVLLGKIAEIIMGQSPPGSTYNEIGEGLPFYQGVADFGNRYPSRRVFCTAPTRIAERGDILLSVRAPIGRVNRASEKCAIGRGLAIVRGKNDADTTFMEFFLRASLHLWDTLESQGSVFGNAKRDDLERIKVIWPELPEQRTIAHILGSLDDKIEINRRMNETLEAMARAIFKSWFVDFDPVRGLGPHKEWEDSPLGRIPKGWRVGKLSDICSTQYGYTASATEEAVGPKFLRVTDINKRNWIEWESVPYCSINEEGKPKYALEIGDIVVARMADPGKSAIIEEQVDAIFASYLVRLKTESLAYAYYIYSFLKSQSYADYSEGVMSGSVQANMNAKVIVGAELVIPPLSVTEAFMRHILSLRQRIVENCHESRTLSALRDMLLPKLISGEIRVRDAEKFAGKVV